MIAKLCFCLILTVDKILFLKKAVALKMTRFVHISFCYSHHQLIEADYWRVIKLNIKMRY